MTHLRKDDYRVETVPLSVAQELVRAYHYSGGGANTATYRHGLLNKAGECVGVAWWIPPTKGAAKASYDGDWTKVLALSRLVVRPGEPTNAASFLMGRSIRLIRGDNRFRALVTYADTWKEHTGAIYRATNWESVGLTKPEAVWVNGAGRMVARKAGPKTRTKEDMEALGCVMVGRFAKHKFRILL